MSEILSRAEQSKETLREMLKANPDIAQAYKETLEELQKPENVAAVATEIMRTVEAARACKTNEQFAEFKRTLEAARSRMVGG